MSNGRRKFERPSSKLLPKKLFIIAVEDKVKEPRYFQILNKIFPQSLIQTKIIEGTSDTSPDKVLVRMKRYLEQKKGELEPYDEAWIVVDKDNWNENQLKQVYEWSKGRDNYNFALSKTKFEYWLLLHFEVGNNIASSRECDIRLKKHIPNYGVNYNFSNITLEQINEAIARAKKRDNPPCKDWPRTTGVTTVYKLVEKIAMGRQGKIQ